jgi:hypothetical protein
MLLWSDGGGVRLVGGKEKKGVAFEEIGKVEEMHGECGIGI